MVQRGKRMGIRYTGRRRPRRLRTSGKRINMNENVIQVYINTLPN